MTSETPKNPLYAGRLRTKQADTVSRRLDKQPEQSQKIADRWHRFIEDHPEFKDVTLTQENIDKWNKDHSNAHLPSVDEVMLSRDIAEMLEHDGSRRAKMEPIQYAGKAEPASPEEAVPQLPESLPGPRLPLRGDRELREQLWNAAAAKLDQETVLPDTVSAATTSETAYDGAPPESNPEHRRKNRARSDEYKEAKKYEQVDQLADEGYIRVVGEEDYAEGEKKPSNMTAESKQEWIKKLEDTIGKINTGDYSGLEQPKKRGVEDVPKADNGMYDKEDPGPIEEPEGRPVETEFEITDEEKAAIDAEKKAREDSDKYDSEDPGPQEQQGRPVETEFDISDEEKAVVDAEKKGTGKDGEKEWDPFENPKNEKLPEDYEAYFAGRSQEPDKEAEKLGPKEASYIRRLGEAYNKIPFKWKVITGLGLMAGLGLAAAGSIPAMALGGIAALQRGAGMAGMFVNFEKHLQNTATGEKQRGRTGKYLAGKEWYRSFVENRSDKERAAMAAVLAVGYTGTMALGMHEIIGFIRGDESLGGELRNWLGHLWSHDATPEIDSSAVMSAHPPIESPTEVMSAAPISEPEIPTVVAEASPGHGYEYMMKRLWEQLQDKHLDPSHYSPDSDLYKIATADPNHIDKVVHELAAAHHFYNPDGTSVLIRPDAHMSFGSGGEIHLGDHLHSDMVQAPENAPTTLPYHPEAPVHAETPAAHEVNPDTHTNILYNNEPSSGPMHPEYAAAHPEIVPPEHVSQADFDQLVQQQREAHAAAFGHATPQVEHYDVPVNLSETHGYVNANGHLYVMGGNKALIDAQAQDYALKHHVSVLVDKSYKLFGVIDTPRFVEYVPNPNGALTQVIHNGPEYAPDTTKFTKQVF